MAAHLHGYTAFPLAGLASLEPVEALRRLWRRERPFLLDGAADADGLGRYSLAGCDPTDRYVVDEIPELGTASSPGAVATQIFAGGSDGRALAPAAPLFRELARRVGDPSWGCAVGLLDYELGRVAERLPGCARPHSLGTPPVDLAAYDALYRYDFHRGQADLLATSAAGAERLRRTLAEAPPPLPGLRTGLGLRSEMGRADYDRKLGRILEALRAGDCYQVNLCRWLRAPLVAEAALPLYLRLRGLAPSPLGFLIRLDGARGVGPSPVLLSNTPELLLRKSGDRIETRPIKGTRRRGSDPERDAALAAELLASAKDRAEHLMIVDLLRNDLGRIATVGSVHVDGFLRRVELPTVHHLVSTVRATLSAGLGLAELLHALLPGGSITGAPKLAAMRLIDELEPYRRGPFYGAFGWLAGDDAQLALNIRTAVLCDGELVLAVGGGIVLDSTADEEWRETEAKAAAFARAFA